MSTKQSQRQTVPNQFAIHTSIAHEWHYPQQDIGETVKVLGNYPAQPKPLCLRPCLMKAGVLSDRCPRH